MPETVATSLLCLLLLLLAAGFVVGGAVLVAMAGASGESPFGQPGWSAWLLPRVYAALLLAGVVAPVALRLLGFGWVAVASTAAGCFFAAVTLLVIFLATCFGQ